MIPKSYWLALLMVAMTSAGGLADESPLVLWYDHPAKEWVEALPVGNGRLGAMVFGGVEIERLQFNEDTLWTGVPHDYSHPGAKDYLPTIRKLLAEGKQREAEQLAMERFMSVPLRQTAYQPFGDLFLEFGQQQATGYRRQLDLDSAVATVRYQVGDATLTRQVLASVPDQVLVVRLTSDKPGRISFLARLETPHPDPAMRHVDGGQLLLQGQLKDRYVKRLDQVMPSTMKYAARLRIVTEGGRVAAEGAGLRVRGADAATLILAAATSFRNYRDVSGDPAARTAQTIAAAGKKSFTQLLEAHRADYRRLFRRVSLDLGSSPAARQPTDERIRQFNSQKDPQLAALYFQFGRYLLISSSRPGSQPANLQGLWNDKLEPPWDSKWTTNINTEMNYWPAEVTNLSECHEPLFDLLADVAQTGRKTAQVHYGCRGWVLHHNTDLWRGTAPINNSNHGIWPTGGAWLCHHLWEHYRYTGDKRFLAERAYPIMKGAALFFEDFLVEDPKTGWLISDPSNSPEHGGLVAGPTMDHQIIRSLFCCCVEASKTLGVDEEFRRELSEMIPRIAPNQIGRYGQLQEWLEDKDNPNGHHRHVSHLWALHPGWEITPRGSPELCAAAQRSLEQRGDGGTGWSLAWKISLWARLENGPHAHQLLSNLLTAQHTYPNLFDSCPPFQIDGNFGAAAGIAEMLLQSHAGEIALLPALPAQAWPTGSVRGLRARGGVEVDLAWKDGRADSVTLQALLDQSLRIRPPRGQALTSVRSGGDAVSFETADDGTTAFPAKAGGEYELSFDSAP